MLSRGVYAILLTIIWDSPNPTIHIRGVDVPVDAWTVNEVVVVLEVLNVAYEDKLKG